MGQPGWRLGQAPGGGGSRRAGPRSLARIRGRLPAHAHTRRHFAEELGLDSRLSVTPIAGHDADAFELTRVVQEDRLPLELVVRNLISDWGVKPRTDDWLTILQESAVDFD
jgi:hypothetical protein